MDDPRDELVRIDATGAVHPVGKLASQRLRSRSGAFRMMASPAHVVVLRYVGEDGRRDAEDGAILRLAGEITAPGTLCDIVGLVGQAGWRGELVVLVDEQARSIFFEHGHVVAATSTVADERIGQVLFRYGALSEAQVEEVAAKTTRERRFGETAVDLGFLAGERLFSLVAKQVEEIVFAVLLASDGMFFFLDGFDDGRVTSHHCLPVGGLLMEGVRRMDEMRYFRDKIPSDQHVPIQVPGRTRPDEDGEVWDAIDGVRSIEALGRAVGKGEFEITRAVFQLVQGGRVTIQAPRATGVEAMVALFNEAMRALFVELDAMGKGDDERQQLAGFATSGGVYDALFAGAGPHPDGSLDHQRIEENVARLAGPDGQGMLKQWLYEYLSFALFLAETALRGGGERGSAVTKRVAGLAAGLGPSGT